MQSSDLALTGEREHLVRDQCLALCCTERLLCRRFRARLRVPLVCTSLHTLQHVQPAPDGKKHAFSAFQGNTFQFTSVRFIWTSTQFFAKDLPVHVVSRGLCSSIEIPSKRR